MTTYTKQQIEDLAGLFFSGEPQDIIESILQDYIKSEIQFQNLDTD